MCHVSLEGGASVGLIEIAVDTDSELQNGLSEQYAGISDILPSIIVPQVLVIR